MSATGVWAGILSGRGRIPFLLPAAVILVTARPSLGQSTDPSNLVRVVDRAEHGEIVVLFGPLDLPPTGSHAEHQAEPVQEFELPRSGWLRGFEADMVDSTGAPLAESSLHHMMVIDPAQRALFSPTALRIVAAGGETGKQELPGSLGLPVAAGQRLLIDAVFHNMTDIEQHDVYLRLRLGFTPAQAGEQKVSVFPFYLDVKPAVGDKAFDLPPGASSQSWEGKPAVSGRLLAAVGHMHRYAEGLRLEDVTQAKVLWTVSPVYDAAGNVKRIPTGDFVHKGGLPIRSDHDYRLTVTYENPTGAVLPRGGMGALGGVFVPDPGESWPKVDPTDPDYLADLKFTRGANAQPMNPAMEETAPTRVAHARRSGSVETVPASHSLPAAATSNPPSLPSPVHSDSSHAVGPF